MSKRELQNENKYLLNLIDDLKEIIYAITIREFGRLDDKLLDNTLNDYKYVREYFTDIYIDDSIFNFLKEIVFISEYNKEYEAFLDCVKRFENCVRRKEKILNSDYVNEYFNKIQKLDGYILHQKKITETDTFSDVEIKEKYEKLVKITSTLVGRSLERIYLPDLVEAMGYTRKPGLIPSQQGEIELDVRAEKDSILGIKPSEKIDKQSVLLAEAKTTISKRDIKEFKKKIDVVSEKYKIISKQFGYPIKIESWIVACYGWNNELRKYAKSLEIKPIESIDLVTLLEENGIMDHRYNPCPEII